VKLRDKGNTLLVVEHDEDTILRADHVIDLGPGAGRLGGEVIAEGACVGSCEAAEVDHRPVPCATRCRTASRRAARSPTTHRR
jgi:excinuclease ABC subunit A